MLLEDAREMLGIIEAKTLGCFRDGRPANQQCLCTLHDKPSDVRGGGGTCQLADEIAEVIGRQEQLLCTVFHGGQTKLLLHTSIIILQQMFCA